jgi:hypothetical protein
MIARLEQGRVRGAAHPHRVVLHRHVNRAGVTAQHPLGKTIQMLIDVKREEMMQLDGGASLSCGQGIAVGAMVGGRTGLLGGPTTALFGSLLGAAVGAALFCRL